MTLQSDSRVSSRRGTTGRHHVGAATTQKRVPSQQKQVKRPRRIKTATVLQMEPVECGAASLAMILQHYKRHMTLPELRSLCGVSRDGSKASHIVKAARQLGLQAAGKQMGLEALRRLSAPTIVFWEFNHYVVVEGFGRHRRKPIVYINDPAKGHRTLTEDEFSAGFTGVVLQFSPGPNFVAGGKKDSFARDVRELLRGTFGAVAIAVIASLLLAAVSVLNPTFMRVFTDTFLVPGGGSILPLIAAMAAVALLSCILVGIEQTHLLRVEIAASTMNSARFMRHLFSLPMSFFSVRDSADLTKRLYLHVKITEALSRDLSSVMTSGLLVVIYGVLMFSYNAELALIGVSIALLNVGLMRWSSRLRKMAVQKVSLDLAKFTTISYSGVAAIETIKATGGEWGFFRRWGDQQASLITHEQRAGMPAAVLSAMVPFLAMLNGAVVLMVGGFKAIDGVISVGLLVSFQIVLASFSRPASTLFDTAPRLQDTSTDMERIKDVEAAEKDPMFSRPETDDSKRLGGRLAFKSVTFGYGRLDAPLIKDFSFEVGPGRQVALVGTSGAGKSTVTKMIAGQYEPRSGEIILDGRAHTTWPRSVLAASVSFVDQDIFLFEGTVRDNVTLWDPTLSDEDVMSALRDACIDDVVSARPGGIHSTVEHDGRNFSGGQRQRLEIARALVRSPSLIVLDEATSALDAQTEYRVVSNIRRRGPACVVIAHRLSTVRDSDEIIVMERGAVIERGSHHELVALGARYADLIKG
jgi:NHLM bacteriocin system ABC transporter peptidase/ATP-binding protein